MCVSKSIVLVGAALLAVVPGLAQSDQTGRTQPVPAMVGAVNNGGASYEPDNRNEADVMLTPPPVSGQAYPSVLGFEERSNYLRAGFFFTSAYTDNALGGLDGRAVSDMSYSVAPIVSLNETTTRLHSDLTYSPGFTFYQRTGSRNEADHNLSFDFQYRLSPHISFSATDSFQKTSSVFNQPTGFSGVSGGAQTPNFSIITPLASRLSNTTNLAISYQYALNSMIGASGTFSNLHFPDPTQVPGLYDSSSQGGSTFYSIRVGKNNYVGAIYQYQRLIAYPAAGQSETQTHAFLLFYTLHPAQGFSVSFFGGPQHADTLQPATQSLQSSLTELRSWSPAAGASLGWQGRSNAFAMSYSHTIAGGAGLEAAVHMDSADGTLRQQVTRTITASVNAAYANNRLIGWAIPGFFTGHSVSGTASLEKQIGQHVGLQLGYTRLHQDYSGVAALATNPDTNREFISLSYDFVRPLGK
jgi:hypothetical protein